MSDLNLIGDEIQFRGELVAVLVASGVTATTLGDFTDELTSETPFREDDCRDECECKHRKTCPFHRAEVGEEPTEYDDAVDDILRAMKSFSKGGLIKFTDLERICKQLQEEGELT